MVKVRVLASGHAVTGYYIAHWHEMIFKFWLAILLMKVVNVADAICLSCRHLPGKKGLVKT